MSRKLAYLARTSYLCSKEIITLKMQEELLSQIARLTAILEIVDDELAFLEDITHGEIGKRVTKIRKMLQE